MPTFTEDIRDFAVTANVILSGEHANASACSPPLCSYRGRTVLGRDSCGRDRASSPSTVAEMSLQDTSPVRYGVIGTGMMGLEHLQNIAHLPGVIVGAVADSDPTSLANGARVAGAGVRSYSNYRDMLADADLDAVVIATPNFTHADVLGDVLSTGLHVMVEKPLCTTVADCQRIIKQAEGYDGVVWMGLEYRWMPPIARLLEHLGRGVCGSVRMVSIREHRFPFLTKVGDWNRFSANTGGTLVEKCCHFFDLMNLAMGDRPLRVMASGAQNVNHLDERYPGNPAGEVPDILDNAFVIVDYPKSKRAMLDLCMFAEASVNEQEISVVGDLGKVEARVSEQQVVVGKRLPGRRSGDLSVEHVVDGDIAYSGMHHGSSWVEHAKFLDCIRTGRPADVTLEDGLWSVAMGVAAHRSIVEGRPVTLAEVMV